MTRVTWSFVVCAGMLLFANPIAANGDHAEKYQTFHYQCKSAKAEQIAHKLREFLGSPFPFSAEGKTKKSVSPQYYIAVDAKTNKIWMHGTARIVGLSRTFFGPDADAEKSIVQGGRYWARHHVASGEAAKLAAILQEIYKESAGTKITVYDKYTLLIFATGQDHLAIGPPCHKSLEACGLQIKMFRCKNVAPTEIAVYLQRAFGFHQSDLTRFYIEPHDKLGKIIVRCSPQVMEQINVLFDELDTRCLPKK